MSYTLDEKRDYAAEMLERAEQALESADRLADTAREMGGGIPGFGGSGNQRAAQQVRSAWNRADRAAHDAEQRIDYWKHKLRSYENRIAERDRVRLTRDDIAGAKFIRVSYGWRKVVRVNKTTVSVDSGYSWVDRIEFDKVLEVRK